MIYFFLLPQVKCKTHRSFNSLFSQHITCECLLHGRDPQGVRVPEASETTSCPGGADRRLPRSLRRLSAVPHEAVRGGGKLCAGCGQSAAGGTTRGKEQGRGGGQRATLTSQDLRTRLGMPGLAAAMKPLPPQGSPQVGAGPAAR